jgi:hypothetical protein
MYGEQARVWGGGETVEYFKIGTWYFYGKATMENNITQHSQYAIPISMKLRLNSMSLETTTIRALHASIMNNTSTSTARTSTSFNTALKF